MKKRPKERTKLPIFCHPNVTALRVLVHFHQFFKLYASKCSPSCMNCPLETKLRGCTLSDYWDTPNGRGRCLVLLKGPFCVCVQTKKRMIWINTLIDCWKTRCLYPLMMPHSWWGSWGVDLLWSRLQFSVPVCLFRGPQTWGRGVGAALGFCYLLGTVFHSFSYTCFDWGHWSWTII